MGFALSSSSLKLKTHNPDKFIKNWDITVDDRIQIEPDSD
jgi:hypothetical protein